MKADDVFLAALEQPAGQVRTAFLDRTCGNDVALRTRVEGLLRAHQEAGNVLDQPLFATTAATGEPSSDDELSLSFLAPPAQPAHLGRLAHYEVHEVVGRGGMGVVLKAFDEKLHRVVAIKVMAAQLATCAAARKRFSREAQAAAAVSHDHIVTIYAVEEANGLPYLVMQYVSGLSLQERLDRDGPLRLDEILRIGLQTAAGLAAAQSQGLIHRDIKPANILLENGVERVKITDFGLARAAADAGMTQDGIVAGSPHYMSPEQARGETLDRRSDLFSLGSVLYAMCTGRTPFRGESTVAVLKRVCEDRPTPIREINAEIPGWLAAIIEKLHAKDPAERYQSAAEVADVLSQHLAQLQHPGLAEPAEKKSPQSAIRIPKSQIRHRRWALAAAAALVLLVVGLGLSEAGGVTHLAATVIRIFTPDGTLVVETDDPGVKVTVEGDGGLVITGAGLEEIRLRPGSYRVHADRDGKPLPLDKDLVTVARGGWAIVKVKLERAPAAVSAKAQQGAFVLLAAGKERKFDTLAEAVLTATDGDTIEIRGNGPFVIPPIVIRQSLAIRAGKGFWPVIRVQPGAPGDDSLITAHAPLVLEGLEIREVSAKRSQPALFTRCLIWCDAKSLHLANCRLEQEEPAHEDIDLVMSHSTTVVRNCQFRNAGAHCASFSNDVPVRFVMDNCLGAGGGAVYLNYVHASHEARLEFRRNTLVMQLGAELGFQVAPDPALDSAEEKRIQYDASGNVFDARLGMFQIGSLVGNWQEARDAETAFAPLIGWRDQRNLYSPSATAMYWSPKINVSHSLAAASLQDWERRWGQSKSGSIEGPVRLQGGDLLAKAATAPEKITPEDFRLRSDSAGYRAGPDGKDLGADVDLVGPGAAYERWKQTPEYQEWLKDTGQLRTESPKPESQAFVVLTSKGAEIRKFDSLAEAVQGASDGDTIEICGNGPFVSSAINIKDVALTIRAAGGFRPVIKLNMEGLNKLTGHISTTAPLILEGLDIQGIGPAGPWSGIGAGEGAPLYVANCRLHLREAEALLSNGTVHIRNCELLGHGNCFGVTFDNGNTRRIIMENCVRLGSLAFYFNHAHSSNKISIQLKRNTLITNSTWLYDLASVPEFPKGQLDQAPKLVDVDASENIFDALSMLQFNQGEDFLAKSKMLSDAEAAALFVRLVSWRDQRNLYADGNAAPYWDIKQSYSPKTVAEWKRLWPQTDSETRDGRVKYHGGNLRSKLITGADMLAPADFRLRPDSAGYKAGKDGKDLGADVDLVGPGAAYERWKKTTEYQEWLKETGQQK